MMAMHEENFRHILQDKRILVTGGTGSIGRVFVERLLRYGPKVIRVLSRDTAKQIELGTSLGNPPMCASSSGTSAIRSGS